MSLEFTNPYDTIFDMSAFCKYVINNSYHVHISQVRRLLNAVGFEEL